MQKVPGGGGGGGVTSGDLERPLRGLSEVEDLKGGSKRLRKEVETEEKI